MSRKRECTLRRLENAIPESARLRRAGWVGDDWFRVRLELLTENRFDARHECPTLCSGEIVEFEIEGHPGLAVSIWTCITGDRVETGFWNYRGNVHPEDRSPPGPRTR